MISSLEYPPNPQQYSLPQLATLENNKRLTDHLPETLQAARTNLLDFTTTTKHDFIVSWHHRLLASKLDQLFTGEITRLIVNMPPRHGKSELATRRLAAYALGRNPDEQIIACSYADALASLMNRDVQRIIDTERYRMVFPGTRLSGRHVAKSGLGSYIRTANLFEVVGHRGYFRSAGSGGALSGMGCTLGIYDDPFKNRDEANSPTYREKVWQFWTNVFSTRQQPGARMLVIMTRWHRDDLAGRLIKAMQEPRSTQWEVLTLPGIMPGTGTHAGDPREEGEALWPYFMNKEGHRKKRMEDRNAYAALYDQNPGDAGGAEWPASYFGEWIWCDPEHWPDTFDLRIVALDPSKGKSDKHGDYSAIVFVGVKNGLVYVDANLERRPPHQIVRDMLTMCSKYRPQFVGIEANQFQELLVHEFELQCGQRFTDTLGVHATPMVNTINKIVRIRRLGPYIVNREFRFKRDSPGCHLLVDQLMDFPNADHDDGPDALEMAIRLPGDIGGCE